MDLNYDSTKLIGNVKNRFKQLERKNWEWRSFYNGWIEGRAQMLNELREGNPDTTSENGLHKHFVSNNEVAVCEHEPGEKIGISHSRCSKCGEVYRAN